MSTTMIRKDFPLLQNKADTLLYFDNAATAQKPQSVIDEMVRFYSEENSNIHRGNYPLSNHAEQLYLNAKETIRRFIGAAKTEEIIFTKGCTESINLISYTLSENVLTNKDNIVTTELEHSSNFFPWEHAARCTKAELRVAKANTDGSIDTNSILMRLDKHTKLVAVTGMSNVTGFKPELSTIIEAAHRVGAKVLIDGAQMIAHSRINVKELDCDYFCFSGHKLYGPMGIGVLYGKHECLNELPPYLYGGNMVETAGDSEVIYRMVPDKFEAGTQNIAGALGLAAAINYLEVHGFDQLLLQEQSLGTYLMEQLSTIHGLRIYGTDHASPVLSFTGTHIGAYDFGVLLSTRGIAVRSGANCAYPLLARMGEKSLCRISLGIYNTKQEVDRLVETIREITQKY